MAEVARFSETSVNCYQSTRCLNEMYDNSKIDKASRPGELKRVNWILWLRIGSSVKPSRTRSLSFPQVQQKGDESLGQMRDDTHSFSVRTKT
jgi:hypothetical protein